MGGGDPPWDTDIPESEAFDASVGGWGADGVHIAFQHSESLTGDAHSGHLDQLWVANVQTRERHKVLRGRIVDPNWRPDGEWLVFHTPEFHNRLFKVRASGAQVTPLTGPGSPNSKLEFAVMGEWSPSGDRILFTIAAGDSSGVWVMQPDGTQAEKIVGWSVMGSWFPDGERIVYVSWDQTVEKGSGRRRQIFVASADGTSERKLTNLPNSAVADPTVSSDGRQIAFVQRARDGNGTEVYLMNADGTGVRQVTNGRGLAKRPDWHPSGKQIVFTRDIPNVSERLYLLDTETLEVTPVFPAKNDQ